MSSCIYASWSNPFPSSALGSRALTLLQGYNFIVLSATNHPDSTAASPELKRDASPTPLGATLGPASSLERYCGALTTKVFDGLPGEIDSLLHSAGVSD